MSAKAIKLQDNSNNALLPVTDATLVQMKVGNETKSVQEVILEDEEVTAAAYNDLESSKQNKTVYLRLSSTTSGNTTTYSLPKTFDEIIELIDNGTDVRIITNETGLDIILYNVLCMHEPDGLQSICWESHGSFIEDNPGTFYYCSLYKEDNNDAINFYSCDLNTSFATLIHTHTNESLGYGFGACGTSKSTAAKSISINNFELRQWGIIVVQFMYGHTASSMTLNINNTGAKDVFYGINGTDVGTGIINTSDLVTMIYNGSAWNIISIHSAGETVKAPAAPTTKLYLIGVTNGTRQAPKCDTGVYLTTTSGELRATSFNEDGTTLANKYLSLANSTSYIKTAGTGLTKSGQTLNHDSSITASTIGPDGSKTLSSGATFAVPKIQYNDTGHIIAGSSITYTMPTITNPDHTKVSDNMTTGKLTYWTGNSQHGQITNSYGNGTDKFAYISNGVLKEGTLPISSVSNNNGGLAIGTHGDIYHSNQITAGYISTQGNSTPSRTTALTARLDVPIISYDSNGHITDVNHYSYYFSTGLRVIDVTVSVSGTWNLDSQVINNILDGLPITHSTQFVDTLSVNNSLALQIFADTSFLINGHQITFQGEIFYLYKTTTGIDEVTEEPRFDTLTFIGIPKAYNNALNVTITFYYNNGVWEYHNNTSQTPSLGIIEINTATNATNLSGGTANQIAYQTAANTTGFIDAPTDGSCLKYDSRHGGFVWAEDNNTDNSVKTVSTSTNSSYPILFKYSANNTGETQNIRFDSDGTTNAYYNPGKNTMYVKYSYSAEFTENGTTLANKYAPLLKYTVKAASNSTVTFTTAEKMQPNTVYVIGSGSNPFTFTPTRSVVLASGSTSLLANDIGMAWAMGQASSITNGMTVPMYQMVFKAGTAGVSFTMPSSVKWKDGSAPDSRATANKMCELTIINDIATINII